MNALAASRAAAVFYRYIGMHPLRVRREIPGHLTDRLQEALWREILHMVNDGIASTGELDESIVYGPGLRWAGRCLQARNRACSLWIHHVRCLSQFGAHYEGRRGQWFHIG